MILLAPTILIASRSSSIVTSSAAFAVVPGATSLIYGV
jgi:hypothetical protein